MAVSMAAALAASLPTPVMPTPSRTNTSTGGEKLEKVKDMVIPNELKSGLDVEAKVEVESVELDGMVVIKILKHASDSLLHDSTGQLLGLDLNGTLEISDAFPLPYLPTSSDRNTDEDKERTAHRAAHAAYSAEMTKGLGQIEAGDNVVGAYMSSPSGNFFKGKLVDAQGLYQSVGGRKGVVVVYDPTKSAQGNVSLRAFRFSSSFADAYAKGKFDTQSLVDHKLTFSNLLVELPINITNSTLVNAFLATLSLPPLALASPSSSPSSSTFSPTSLPLLPPNHAPLSLLLPSSLTTSLESTSRALDEYRREADSLSFNARDIARQKVKLDALLSSGGVGEDEARRMVRVPAEASRLNSLLLLAQVDEFAKGMAGAAGGGVARMFAGQV